ncbi:hypothetical protein EOA32_10135 [Mesorhizobium sp. M1A.F.Ca.ET.072.01.1.1]|uniref:hypothetical protein n=1 Tax=Mesorhizobium sp. M1A.F.Ca.ET.072.01.1.1 TaxID=2496753 RepID=UPI000FD38071|nr:hypothetical protein [Mesorhizobium sp. M1A.F.Ca.ET.072.01.1.1]RUW53235.1 hypothetical protein EOA32_10135 [Mesorhizobium sp. M1A.F.Ca.ET.072.01.1.1]TIU97196.1 MAG: hypothetical protein E5W04_26680 [Mesorhizobium sp.]
MSDNEQERTDDIQAVKDFRVRFLIRETGIAEAQARELVDIIGNDANSLLGEARLLARKQR